MPRAALREGAASASRRRWHDAFRARYAVCLAVCVAAVLAVAAPSEAAGGRTALVAGSDEILDSRLLTTLVDLPLWLRGDGDRAGKARGTRLFLAAPTRASAAGDASDARRSPSDLQVRELAFPTRRVAVERSVTRAVFFKLSVGLDRELESGGIGDGEITPSVGLQFERRFR